MAKPDFTNSDIIVNSMIRVDHAGEYGASRIYQGQLKYCKNHQASSIIKHMFQQEEQHLYYFNDLLLQRNVRPTIFMPFWHVSGYIAGSVSMLLGSKFAMLLTEGVEESIEQHYQEQINYLKNHNIEKDLLNNIHQFQLEEIEHKDIALIEGSKKLPFDHLIKKTIKLFCEVAIFLSKRF